MHDPLKPHAVWILLMSAAVSGCGGGGGGGSVPQPSPTPTQAPTACTSIATRPAGSGRIGGVARGSDVSPSQLYVSYRTTATRGADAVDRAAGAMRGLDLGSSNGVAHRAVTLAPGSDLQSVSAKLRATAGVVDVAPVHLRVPLAFPNDPLYDNDDQWYLFRTNASAGWALSQGNEIAIAVIDTGVDETNADLAPKLEVHESVVNGVRATSSTARRPAACSRSTISAWRFCSPAC